MFGIGAVMELEARYQQQREIDRLREQVANDSTRYLAHCRFQRIVDMMREPVAPLQQFKSHTA